MLDYALEQDFNPHHHAGGDDWRRGGKRTGHRFQSTPPRRWWRDTAECIGDWDCISIHTTTQVVTVGLFLDVVNQLISIHTTTQVVTCIRYRQSFSSVFQSTPPRRWWPDNSFKSYASPLFQSTPPRRWWQQGSILFKSIHYFNPHHHAGGDNP